MLHGAGGTVMHNLVKNYILKYFGGTESASFEVPLEALDDAAVVDDIVLKSDSHAVRPIFFPGGDIGRLAVSGTVNDIAVLGAEPYALACGFILEEGLPLTDFERILASMQETCQRSKCRHSHRRHKSGGERKSRRLCDKRFWNWQKNRSSGKKFDGC
jgi:hydrogenase expression/formation protein HypE